MCTNTKAKCLTELQSKRHWIIVIVSRTLSPQILTPRRSEPIMHNYIRQQYASPILQLATFGYLIRKEKQAQHANYLTRNNGRDLICQKYDIEYSRTTRLCLQDSRISKTNVSLQFEIWFLPSPLIAYKFCYNTVTCRVLNQFFSPSFNTVLTGSALGKCWPT